MPHTSHRKKLQQRSKRTNIVDENGWTRVANTNSHSRAPQSPSYQGFLRPTPISSVSEYKVTTPADGMTIENLYARFQEVEKRWLESTSWRKLKTLLRNEVDGQTIKDIHHAIVLGTGSFCGVEHGWIQRYEVSLYQLSAFKAVLDTLEDMRNCRPAARAQDPVYNELDVELLNRLGIEKVDHPVGLDAVTSQTFVYAPCAELMVQISCLKANPSLAMFTGKLDFIWKNGKGEICTNRIMSVQDSSREDVEPISVDSVAQPETRIRLAEQLTVMERFQQDKVTFALPELDVKDFPFHDVYLYSRQPPDLVQ